MTAKRGDGGGGGGGGLVASWSLHGPKAIPGEELPCTVWAYSQNRPGHTRKVEPHDDVM